MAHNTAHMGETIIVPTRKRFTYERVYLKLYRIIKSTVKHTVLISVAISCIFPLVWMVSSALKTQATVFTDLSLIPSNPQFVNFAEAWTKGKFAVYFFNSVFYTLFCVFGVLLISSLAAFAFARFQFPGKNALYYLFLSLSLDGFLRLKNTSHCIY
jgi:ABC-type glycerol-3-phosphate transport system permease component